MKHRHSLGNPISRGLLAGLALVLLAASSLLQAAQVRVELDRNPVAFDESLTATFVIEDADISEAPDFSPVLENFKILGQSQSKSVSISNGEVQRSTRYILTLLPKKTGKTEIPSIRFGSENSPRTPVEVLAAGQGGAPDKDAAQLPKVFMEVEVDDEHPLVQQQVVLTLRIFSRVNWRDAQLSEPEFQGGEVLLQQLGDDRQYQKLKNGQTWQVVERRYAVFPQVSGALSLEPFTLELRLPVQSSKRNTPFGGRYASPFMDDFFNNTRYTRKIVRSKGLSLDVQPIPDSFQGQHWLVARSVQLKERWSQGLDRLKTGEPVTRRLILEAEGATLGQLPDISMPQIDGLHIYPEEPQNHEQATSQGVKAVSQRNFAIIPERPGTYQLPPLEIKWWNSAARRMETARLPAQTLKVEGTAQARANTPSDTVAQADAQRPTQQKTTEAVPGSQWRPSLWAYLSAALALAWIITLYFWWRTVRQRQAPDTNEQQQKPATNIKDAIQTLQQACAQKDAVKTRQALLKWAQALWPEQPPTSLEALAQRLDAPLADEIQHLSRHLYGDPAQTWQPEVIQEQSQRIGKQVKQPSQKKDRQALKALYPA